MAGSVLVAGATGVVGNSALEQFLGEDRVVIALSRRVPNPASDRPFRHLSIDLTDRVATRAGLADVVDVSHVVYAALEETPGLFSGWVDRPHIERNGQMLRNLVDGLLAAGSRVRHVSLLQGTKAYGVHLRPIPIPAKESEARFEHPNFYWLQQDYLASKAVEAGFSYTIFRPQFIFGGVVGAAMNMIPVIGAYGALCREEGIPFAYPGGRSYVTEGVDARLLAKAISWAGDSAEAADQIFNITNGDVFEWRNLWPALAEELDVTTGPDRYLSMVDFFQSRVGAWKSLAVRLGLREHGLGRFLGESHHYADFAFSWGQHDGDRPPAFVSTVKLRQAGFHGTMDTEDSLRYWLRYMRQRQLLP